MRTMPETLRVVRTTEDGREISSSNVVWAAAATLAARAKRECAADQVSIVWAVDGERFLALVADSTGHMTLPSGAAVVITSDGIDADYYPAEIVAEFDALDRVVLCGDDDDSMEVIG